MKRELVKAIKSDVSVIQILVIQIPTVLTWHPPWTFQVFLRPENLTTCTSRRFRPTWWRWPSQSPCRSGSRWPRQSLSRWCWLDAKENMHVIVLIFVSAIFGFKVFIQVNRSKYLYQWITVNGTTYILFRYQRTTTWDVTECEWGKTKSAPALKRRLAYVWLDQT